MKRSEPAARLEGRAAANKPRPWAAALLVLAVAGVLWGSLTPAPPSLSQSVSDKLQHFGAYALLTALAFATVRGRSWRAVLGVLLLGLVIEFGQALPALGRSASPLDVLANAAGAGLVAAVWPGRRR